MTEPLSFAASVVGITVPALHGVRLLSEDLQQLKEAPKTVKRLSEDVQSKEWDLLGAGVLDELRTTISSCTQACNLFRTDLQRWTRHSEGGKLAWQDQTSVGFFKQGQIKAMSEQLQNCKLLINSVVNIATLGTMSLVQAEIKGAVTTTDKQLVVLESRLEELNLSSDDDKEAGPREGKAEALQQLEEERKALGASRMLLEELLLKAQEDAVAKAAVKS
ncbi:hypothetical protein CC86DRAFT_369990 [Ophiobolus disseminans]|uniref:Azaphilone pigments biosynthesis cluster protein L N-terminal domain-containing protein n=1 Tax=Ophiobolus disseminans TaxID=1469910 RepID=A0A6A7A2S5_9PLEO|nr:hypothetical protein CC86DRAFT_369990 [Ophiobolus disseminans]